MSRYDHHGNVRFPRSIIANIQSQLAESNKFTLNTSSFGMGDYVFVTHFFIGDCRNCFLVDRSTRRQIMSLKSEK
jgi:hypothetical protein